MADTIHEPLAAQTLLAGREIDALVAERVIGLEVRAIRVISPEGLRSDLEEPLPCYSTDIAAAWLVVNTMRARGFCFNVWSREPDGALLHRGEFGAEFEQLERAPFRYPFKSSADTPMLAICRAAIAASQEGKPQVRQPVPGVYQNVIPAGCSDPESLDNTIGEPAR